jgi:hypothetical protein
MRPLRSYLLLPRPGDLVKAWIFPACFAIGALAGGGVGSERLLRAAIVWIALELLIYQARYQWNDIRGFAADQRHPESASRGRLPGPSSRGRRHRGASALVIAARLALVGVLAAALPALDLGGVLLVLTVAVFGVALLYEALRTRATGVEGQVPPPVRPTLVALWLFVGGGYAVRGVAGLGLAVDLGSRPWLAAAALVTMWSFGVAFVTSRWALEALAFGRRRDDGGIAWQAQARQAREHSLALVRWLPKSAPAGVGPNGLAGWRPLMGAAFTAPWSAAALLAAASAALTGRLLAGPAEPLQALVAAIAGLLLAVAVLSRAAWRARAALLGAPALAAVFALSGAPRPALAALPWLAIVGAHLFFTAQSPATLAQPLRAAIGRALRRLPRRRHGGFVPELADRS